MPGLSPLHAHPLPPAHQPQSHQSGCTTEVRCLPAEDGHGVREQTCPCSPSPAPCVTDWDGGRSPALPGEEGARRRQQGLSTDCHSPVLPKRQVMPTPTAVLFHRNYFFALFLLWLISPQPTTTFSQPIPASKDKTLWQKLKSTTCRISRLAKARGPSGQLPCTQKEANIRSCKISKEVNRGLLSAGGTDNKPAVLGWSNTQQWIQCSQHVFMRGQLVWVKLNLFPASSMTSKSYLQPTLALPPANYSALHHNS